MPGKISRETIMRIFPATNLARALAGMAAGLYCLLAIPASATSFVFDETASSVPGFFVSASITINDGFADLPSVSNRGNPGPYPFGNGFALQAFDIILPAVPSEAHYTLADFTASGFPFDFPQWSISPDGITFINKSDTTDFFIRGFDPLSTIQFESDGPTVPPDCHFTGRCIASGHWVPVPEPSSAALLITVIGIAFALRKRDLQRGV